MPDPWTATVLINGTITRFYTLRDEDATPNPTITLTEEIGAALPGGTSVSLVRNVYAGTDLEDGNLVSGQFPGPYLYDVTQRGPSETQTTIATAVASPTRLASSSIVDQACLEVGTATTFPAPPFSPFAVRVGRGTGSAETGTVVDRVLRFTAANIVTANIGTTTLVVNDSTVFPDPASGELRYRIILDRGTVDEEIVTVFANDGATTLTLVSPLTITHAPGVNTAELLEDTLVFAQGLNFAHAGRDDSASRAGDRVEQLIDELTVVDASLFPNAGTLLLNFGHERAPSRQKITNVVSTTILEVGDSALFPTTGFPYAVVVSPGTPVEEFRLVTANNTGLNQLTLDVALDLTHTEGEYVEFFAPTPISLDYQDIDGNVIELETAQVLPSGYDIGTSVMESPSLSTPEQTGVSYPLLMPPDFNACLKVLFDRVRAAGITVEFLENT